MLWDSGSCAAAVLRRCCIFRGSPCAVLIPHTLLLLVLSEQDGTCGEPCGASGSPFAQSWLSPFWQVLYLALFFTALPWQYLPHSIYKCNLPS